ncbi:MAG: putative monovalent cation/H+ antiporter subunit A [Chloroflexales bacterium]|nr:putative monovalent cation/H+ antiporter subunit A [Chloroflexales bacterium]
MLTAILSGFSLSLVVPWIYRVGRGSTGWIIALLPLTLLIYFLQFLPIIGSGQVLTFSYPWIPSLDISLSFRLDGLSLLFALLICGIGALVLVYAGGYMGADAQLGRLYAFLLLFMAAMVGLVTSDNLISLFVFWELTTISSYLLIGYKHNYEQARKAALQGLLVTGAGGLALLAGMVLLAIAGGTTEISALLAQGSLAAHPLYLPILVLILIGAFTKSAQVPFHFWLPGAMEAPTPISAYLHSATMVKAGVYLLARLNPVLGSTEVWQITLTSVGSATMLLGGFLAIQQTDLKRILAYTTVSALGALVSLIGIGTTDALKAAVVFLIGHALYKGALFMVAGSIDQATGSRDISQLGGLRHSMPITMAAGGLAAFSMAGLPPLFGFIAKEALYKAKLEEPILISAAVLGNVFVVAAAGLVFVRVFLGKEGNPPQRAYEAPLSMWLGPLILAVIGLLVALFSVQIGNWIVGPATSAVIGETKTVELLLWAGIEGAAGQALALSVVTIALGVGLYLGRSVLSRFSAMRAPLAALGPTRLYQVALDGMLNLARLQTRIIQNGSLQRYLLMSIGSAVLLVSFALLRSTPLRIPTNWIDIRFYEALVAVMMLAAIAVIVSTRSRLTAVVAIGAVGYGIALVFLFYGGADLAMTQFAIESLTVILFVLVIYRLPTFNRLSGMASRIRDAIVALSVGTLMTTLTLAVVSQNSESRLSEYFAENSWPLASGRNVVNVILVDFRALDTLGEITVLALAAVGIYALIRLRLDKEQS